MIAVEAGMPKYDAVTMGELIRGVREARHLRQLDLAMRSGVSPANISKIERGRSSPSVGTLQKIADALDIRVGDLTGETVDEAINDSYRQIASLVVNLKLENPVGFLESLGTLSERDQSIIARMVRAIAFEQEWSKRRSSNGGAHAGTPSKRNGQEA